MAEQELEFLEWMFKFNEKLTFLLLNVREQRDISESDYAILEILHKVWFNGEHPLFKTVMDAPTESAVQGGLFADTTSDFDCGITIDTTKA